MKRAPMKTLTRDRKHNMLNPDSSVPKEQKKTQAMSL